MGPTELQEAVWRWRDMYPKGSQAQLRTAFADAGIDISKTYADECWHRWASERMAQFEQGLLNEDQVRALFERV